MMPSHTSSAALPVSRGVAAAVTLMCSGISNLSLIAAAVGLTPEEVERIDAADDPEVRRLAVRGIPDNFIFRLRVKVTCPTCGSRIYLVPCVSCKLAQLLVQQRSVSGQAVSPAPSPPTPEDRSHEEPSHGSRTSHHS